MKGIFAALGSRAALITIAVVLAALIAVVVTYSIARRSTETLPNPAPSTEPNTAPAATPDATPAPATQQPAQGDQPKITYTPWTKVCPKGQEANGKPVCFTGRDGRIESGQPVVAAVLIEPQGEPRKLLRVTLPLGMSLQSGTRVIIDQGQPLSAPYVICFNGGCISDYEATDELVTKLKQGQTLTVQGVNGSGQGLGLSLPLADFAKVHDGPPSDPSALGQQPPQR